MLTTRPRVARCRVLNGHSASAPRLDGLGTDPHRVFEAEELGRRSALRSLETEELHFHRSGLASNPASQERLGALPTFWCMNVLV